MVKKEIVISLSALFLSVLSFCFSLYLFSTNQNILIAEKRNQVLSLLLEQRISYSSSQRDIELVLDELEQIENERKSFKEKVLNIKGHDVIKQEIISDVEQGSALIQSNTEIINLIKQKLSEGLRDINKSIEIISDFDNRLNAIDLEKARSLTMESENYHQMALESYKESKRSISEGNKFHAEAEKFLNEVLQNQSRIAK
ncbi:MAG: hypothetical protein EPO31_00345 [Gammaproteobacteria bacterium]|nr:MAG: hypothetical protein EPO31_00345 [Gammaproteobacteria bacterium]